jgi:DNA primase
MTSNVDQIKSKIDIVSLVSSYIKLEKAGGNFKGKCPFHNEKTPSFFVSPDRGSYYCFGCQAKGDIFTFVQEFEGLDFIGSLKVLADRTGVVLDFGERSDKTEKERLFGVLEQAVFFYQKKLSENKDALDYLHRRSVNDQTVKDFRIGFAPMEWRSLFDFLSYKGVSEKDMLDVGLIKKKDESGYAAKSNATSGSGRYDTFRGRIMFPISDSSGRVVGFSGRILIADDKSPKYLNSPETQLFNKSEILFGLDKAKRDIRIKDYSILVEGQMDLIMLHQVGISNTGASSGTALTAEHLIKLRRMSNRIIMAFDADSAGFNASNRSAQLALSLGMELKVAQLSQGKDPADLAKENPDELKRCLKDAKHIIDFYTDGLLSRGLEPRALGQEIKKNVLPYVSLLSSTIERDHFIKNIAKKTFIKEEALWDDLSKTSFPDSFVRTAENQFVEKTEIGITRANSIERKLIGLIIWQKEVTRPVIDALALKEKVGNIVGNNINELMKNYEKDQDSLLFETESYYNGKTDLETDVSELLIGLEEEYLKKRFAETMILLQKAEQQRDSGQVLKYLEECQNISQRINAIKNINEKK